MAKHIHLGWSTSQDEIPQPTSIITGRNLRKNSDEASKPQKAPEQKPEWMSDEAWRVFCSASSYLSARREGDVQ